MRSQVLAVVLGLIAIFTVARVIGVGEPPVIVDQVGQPEPPRGPAESGSASPVSTALTTAAFGFVAFVIGQFALKLFVEPIQEQARTVGKVAHALTYYRNVGGNLSSGSGTDSRTAEARKTYRDLAAVFRMNLRVIPFYRFFSSLGLVLPKEQVWHASTALIGLSNTVQKGSAADDVNRYRHEIQKSLKIDS